MCTTLRLHQRGKKRIRSSALVASRVKIIIITKGIIITPITIVIRIIRILQLKLRNEPRIRIRKILLNQTLHARCALMGLSRVNRVAMNRWSTLSWGIYPAIITIQWILVIYPTSICREQHQITPKIELKKKKLNSNHN